LGRCNHSIVGTETKTTIKSTTTIVIIITHY